MTSEHDDDLQPSKSQLKREAHAMQELGEALVKLSKSELGKIPLPDDLLSAVQDAQRIHQRGAMKRQLQYIGKIMRNIDIEPVQKAYAQVTNHYLQDVEHHHQLEKWRDRLITEGDRALGDLLDTYPQIDRQHVRQLFRQAVKEKRDNKPAKSSRELFRYIRDISDSAKNNQ